MIQRREKIDVIARSSQLKVQILAADCELSFAPVAAGPMAVIRQQVPKGGWASIDLPPDATSVSGSIRVLEGAVQIGNIEWEKHPATRELICRWTPISSKHSVRMCNAGPEVVDFVISRTTRSREPQFEPVKTAGMFGLSGF